MVDVCAVCIEVEKEEKTDSRKRGAAALFSLYNTCPFLFEASILCLLLIISMLLFGGPRAGRVMCTSLVAAQEGWLDISS